MRERKNRAGGMSGDGPGNGSGNGDISGFQRRARDAARRRRRQRRIRLSAALGGLSLALGGAALWFWSAGLPLPAGQWFETARPSDTAPEAPAGTDMARPRLAPGDDPGHDPRHDPEHDPEDDFVTTSGFIDLPGDPLWIERSLDTGAEAALQRHDRPETLPPERGSGPLVLGHDLLLRPGERVALTLPSSQEDFAVFQAQRRARRQAPEIDHGTGHGVSHGAGHENGASPVAGVAPVLPDPQSGQQADSQSDQPHSPPPPPSGPPRPPDAATARALQIAWQAHDMASGANPGSRSDAANRVAFTRMWLMPSRGRGRLYADSLVRVRNPTGLAELLRTEGVDDARAAATAAAAAERFGLEMLDSDLMIALRRPLAPEGAGGASDTGGDTRGDTGSFGTLVQAAIYRGGQFLGALALSDPDVGLMANTGASADPDTDTDTDTGTDGQREVNRMVEGSDPWLARDLPTLVGEAGPDMTGDRLAATAGAPLPGATTRVLDAFYATALRMGLSTELTGEIVTLLSEGHNLEVEAGQEDRVTLIFDETAGELDHVLFVGIESSATPVRCYLFRPGPEQSPACYGPRPGGVQVVEGPGAAGAGAGIEGAADAAVQALVNRIIQIESAGRIDARNPLSTATGPGQFLDSTWLRMMRTYRPDLVARHSRQELLNLRVTDYELSRQMVFELAREGERYLRSRGHQITPGRLYLAHFLGMEGAHVALSAPREAPLASLFSAGVISANPHLRGRDAGFVVDWAENLMARSRGARAPAVIREPEGLGAFRELVDGLLERT